MTFVSTKAIVIAITAAGVLAGPAFAASSRQNARQVRPVAPDAQTYDYRAGANAQFSTQAGDHYLDRATDPDPSIRSELARDANVYNGNE